jgi:hypothetical protein
MEEAQKGEKRRNSKGRVRRKFKFPVKVAVPVRALWEASSPQEKEKAHQTGAVLLEYWMGRIKKEEAAQKLGIPPLRVWQLSQQALAGLAAGLVKQPKTGKKKLREALPSEEDPKQLNKKIQGLEKDLELMSELVKLLRDLPGNREVLKKAEEWGGKKKKPRMVRPESGDVVGGEKPPGPKGTDIQPSSGQ